MHAEPAPCDVLVVGGGPAAATSARLLALWGHDVVLAAGPTHRDADLPEALTPSCQKFFDVLGIAAHIEAAGFVRSTGHTVWWGGAERLEAFDGGRRGWQVTSGRLGEVLRQTAVDAGARLVSRALTEHEVLGWPARFRVDATGRHGVLARPLGGRQAEPGHRTVALIGVWSRPDPWPIADATHTLLESYVDGWAWSVPVDATSRAFAVMVDPQTTALARGQGAGHVYLGELSKTQRFSSILKGADLARGPNGWDASMYCAQRPTGADWLLAGDAMSFIDPLSSAGARKAMASGWLAAVTLNTVLRTSAMHDAAFACFAARERATYQGFLALTRRFLADGAPSLDEAFWADRSDTRRGDSGDRSLTDFESDLSPATGSDDRAAVLQAWERIRAAAELRLTLAPHVTLVPRPALREREIVLETRLVTPDLPDGIRFLDAVDVVLLTRLVPTVRQVPDLFEAYTRESGAQDLPAVLTALATAVARGWLIDG